MIECDTQIRAYQECELRAIGETFERASPTREQRLLFQSRLIAPPGKTTVTPEVWILAIHGRGTTPEWVDLLIYFSFDHHPDEAALAEAIAHLTTADRIPDIITQGFTPEAQRLGKWASPGMRPGAPRVDGVVHFEFYVFNNEASLRACPRRGHLDSIVVVGNRDRSRDHAGCCLLAC